MLKTLSRRQQFTMTHKANCLYRSLISGYWWLTYVNFCFLTTASKQPGTVQRLNASNLKLSYYDRIKFHKSFLTASIFILKSTMNNKKYEFPNMQLTFIYSHAFESEKAKNTTISFSVWNIESLVPAKLDGLKLGMRRPEDHIHGPFSTAGWFKWSHQ